MGLDHSTLAKAPISTPVTLHIYDMGHDPEVQAMNRVLKVLGTGAFHCGVEVYGREWSFQGRVDEDEDGTGGVFWCRPRRCEGHTYHESLYMGVSQLSEDEVFKVIGAFKAAWLGKHYDLLKRNCCHFVDALCRALGLGGLPEYLMSLAGTGAALADTGDYLEEQSKALALDAAEALSRAKEGCRAGCVASSGYGCMPSLCENSRGRAPRISSSRAEFEDVAGEPALVSRLVPSCESPSSQGRERHLWTPLEPCSPCGVSCGRPQLVPRSRAAPAHARYMPQEAPARPLLIPERR